MPIYGGGGTGTGPGVPVRALRTAGDIAVGSTGGVWTTFDATTDLTLAAATGDIINIRMTLLTTASAQFDLDVVTVVAGAPLHFASSNGGLAAAVNGISGLYFDGTFRESGAIDYVVQAGDLTAGQVTLRVVYRSGAAGGTFYASTNYPFMWSAQNERH